MAQTYGIKRITTRGLKTYLDAGNKKSYPGSGNIFYDLVGGNNATLVLSPTFSNGSFSFDGSEFISLSNRITMRKEAGTISFWVSIGNAGSRGLFTSAISSYWSLIQISSTGFTTESLSNCNSFDTPSDYGGFNINDWYFITLKFDNQIAYWYVNGKFIGNPPGYGAINCGSTASNVYDNLAIDYIGGATAYATAFIGRFATFMFHDVALSDREILNNYNSLKSRYGL